MGLLNGLTSASRRLVNRYRCVVHGSGGDGSGASKLEQSFLRAGGRIALADAQSWRAFWRDRPSVVALDAEGTHFSPPLLVQIAYDDGRVLLDVPGGGRVGRNLERLLGDPTITKVFFGPPANEALGCAIENAVDAQRAAHDAELPGLTEPGRLPSLAATAARVAPIPGAATLVKNRRLQKSFRNFRRRQRGFEWLSTEARLYSAADAWATLEVYRALDGIAPAALAATRRAVAEVPRTSRRDVPNDGPRNGKKRSGKRGGPPERAKERWGSHRPFAPA